MYYEPGTIAHSASQWRSDVSPWPCNKLSLALGLWPWP